MADNAEKLTVYFDYTCPYCYQGIMDLVDLIPDYPGLVIEWIPCEAHPLPEPARVHGSLAGQAMLAAREYGADILKFHKDILTAHFVERQRIDDINVLTGIAAACGADMDQTARALKEQRYKQNILDNNHLVWDTLAFEAVPCYQCGRRLLASHEDVMISKKQLKAFLDSLKSL